MKRRQLLISLGTLAVFPLGRAQSPRKIWRIGFLGLNEPGSPIAEQFRKGISESLGRFGYKDGENIVIEWRYARGQFEDLPAIVNEFVRLKVDLIVTPSNPATSVAQRATKTIPIVMVTSGLPVENGFIANHARPGGNITGLDTWPTPKLSEKTYQILKQAVPTAKVAAFIGSPVGPKDPVYGDEFARRIAANVGLSIVSVGVTKSDDLPRAFERLTQLKPDVLLVSGGTILSGHFREIADFAAKRKLVSISATPSYPEQGGLLGYRAHLSDMWDRAASYIDRILRGAKPGDLPVEQPAKYELVLNKRTAKAMGLALPPSFMAQVDRVIE